MKRLVMASALTLLSFQATAFDRVHAKISKIYSESNRFTLVVADSDIPQQCGGVFYEVYRDEATPHFKELYSLALAAFTSKANVEIVVKGCADVDRAVIDHMAIY
ncbi:hypothetical protein L3V74_08725 [Xanthomonas sp. PPL560]|uniref:Uncharacterized protein n=2 Tax=Xanthomonas indica TaxID=2912242 RepID=A0ABS9WQ75_9XANT|nr:hypothetical protein [Xanthomonas indica]